MDDAPDQQGSTVEGQSGILVAVHSSEQLRFSRGLVGLSQTDMA